MPALLPTGISIKGVIGVVVVTVLDALALLLAVTRFVLRRKHGLAADDFCLIFALCGLVVMLAGQYMACFKGGEGYSDEQTAQHPETVESFLRVSKKFPAIIPNNTLIWNESMLTTKPRMQLQYWLEPFYTLTIVFIKTSILVSYNRVFGHVKTTRNIILILLGLVWAWGISMLLVCLFQCSPIEKVWHPEKDGYCVDFMKYEWGKSVSNLVMDWMILIVPIRPVLKLQMPLSQKALVFAAFMCGSLASIASTVRAIMLSKYDVEHLGESIYNGGLWVFIEPAMGVMSCCLPLLGRVSHSCFNRLSTWLTSRHNSQSKHSSGFRRTSLISPPLMHDQHGPGLMDNEDTVHTMKMERLSTTDRQHMFPGGKSYQVSVTGPALGLHHTESTRSLVEQDGTFVGR